MANQFLLHYNGSDTSTTFTNDGTEADDFTASGDAQLDTAQQKFGSASGLFDGTGDYIANGSDFALNTGSPGWTIEGWYRFNTHGANHVFWHMYKASTAYGVTLYKNTGGSGQLKMSLSSDGTSNDIGISEHTGSKSSWSTGTWYHIALVRDVTAGEYYLYVDGVLDLTVSESTAVNISDMRMRIGANKAGTIFLNGWADEFRVSDTCEYPSGTGFTPPTAEFTGPPTTGTLEETLPVLTLLAGNKGASLTLPMLTLSAATPSSGSAALDLPLKTLAAGSDLPGGTLTTNDMILPLLTSTGALEQGNAGNLTASLPVRTLIGRGNESAYLTLPLFTTDAALKTGNITNTSARLPALRVSATGTPSGVYSGSMTLPLKQSAGAVDAGKVYTADLTLPKRTLSASTLRSAYATGNLTLPLLELTGAGWVASTATASMELPSLVLVSRGSNPIDTVYRTWVMNTRNGALTEYVNFDFNSFTEFNGLVLAAGPSGIHTLGTQDLDDAAEIDAVFRTGISGFNTSYVKRIPKLYIGYRADGDILFKTLTTHDGPRVYRIPANGNASHHQRRVPIGRGPKSTYWQFEVANENGADFSMNSILLYPQVLNRRNI